MKKNKYKEKKLVNNKQLGANAHKRIAGLIFILLFFIVVVLLARNVSTMTAIKIVDTSISQFVYSFRTPFLTKNMIIISFFGADMLLAISIGLLILLSWEKHKKEAVLFFTILVMGGIINLLLKELFQRPRPAIDPIFILSSYSFPSAHAMNSFLFYTCLAYFMYHFTRNALLTIIAIIISASMILLVGISRVYLGVHYPSDVLAGYIAGLFWFVSCLLIWKKTIYEK